MLEVMFRMTACQYCDNSLINEDLTSNDDYSACVIGFNSNHGYRMCLSSGWGRSLRLEGEKYYEGHGWQNVTVYYPKYCPECGRKITECMKK